jgi:hypothetical protein
LVLEWSCVTSLSFSSCVTRNKVLHISKPQLKLGARSGVVSYYSGGISIFPSDCDPPSYGFPHSWNHSTYDYAKLTEMGVGMFS